MNVAGLNGSEVFFVAFIFLAVVLAPVFPRVFGALGRALAPDEERPR